MEVKNGIFGLNKENIYKVIFSFCLVCFAVIFPILTLKPVRATEYISESDPYIVFGSVIESMLSDARRTGVRTVSVEKYRDYVRLDIDCEGYTNDPFVTFTPDKKISADEYKFIVMLVRCNRPDSYFKLYLDAGTHEGYSENLTVKSEYTGVGAWQILFFDMKDENLWNGEIRKIRLDYIDGVNAAPNDYADIAGISFCGNADNLYDAVGRMTEYLLKPVQTYNNFNEVNRSAFEKNINFTQISFINRNLKLTQSVADYTNDPYAGIQYDKLCESFNFEKLNASDIAAVTLRFKVSERIEEKNRVFELFYWAGEMVCPTGGYSERYTYLNNHEWQSAYFSLADSMGWQGEIGGFRLDWCTGADRGTYAEISDILLFSRADHARMYNDIVNSVDFSSIRSDEYIPPDKDSDESQNLVNKEESNTDSYTIEDVPEYPTATITIGFSDTKSDGESSDVLLEDNNTSDLNTENVEISPSESDTEKQISNEGSDVPFYIMCGFLICLSISSIVSVIIIRSKNK